MQPGQLAILKGLRVTLRRPIETDIDARLVLGRDSGILHMFGVSEDKITEMTRENAEIWVQRISEHPYAWMIECGTLIGEVRLDHVNFTDRRASLAIGILDAARLGQGLGTEAIMLVLAYAFDTLGLHRVALRVLAYNERAIRSYRKCGFTVEGRERESALVGGTFYDDIMMGILDHEFQSLKSTSKL
jgi:RimJ/RimL family protein N-acetyltransferase